MNTNLLQNQKGLSLIQSLVSLAIVSTLIATSSHLLFEMNRGIKRINTKDQYQQMVKEFKFLLNSSEECSNTFGGIKINKTAHLAQKVNLGTQTISEYTQNDFANTTGFMIETIQLEIIEALSTENNFKARASLIAAKPDSNTPLKLRPENFYLTLTLDDENQITDCQIFDPKQNNIVNFGSGFSTTTLSWQGATITNSATAPNYTSINLPGGVVVDSSLPDIEAGTSLLLPKGDYILLGQVYFSTTLSSSGQNRVEKIVIEPSITNGKVIGKKKYEKQIPQSAQTQHYQIPIMTQMQVKGSQGQFNITYRAQCKESPCPDYEIKEGSTITFVRF